MFRKGTNNSDLARGTATRAANALYNLFNGGEKMFDDWAPVSFKNWFENLINQQLIAADQPRLR